MKANAILTKNADVINQLVNGSKKGISIDEGRSNRTSYHSANDDQVIELAKIANSNRGGNFQNMANKQMNINTVQTETKNNTGIPDKLKSGIETLSGFSMDDVKVHYNSDKPVKMQAHAFAQGTDIHLASGQEKHLPHEAWHIVQQKQGSVKATMQMKGDLPVNDNPVLEQEADVMGFKAAHFKNDLTDNKPNSTKAAISVPQTVQAIQLLVNAGLPKGKEVIIKRSTSKEFHGEKAIIIGEGPDANEYIVEVRGQQVIARLDQLLLPGMPVPEFKADINLDDISRLNIDGLLKQIMQAAKEKMKFKHPVVVGGSFAAFVYALKEGKSSRTPRDIDIIVNKEDWKEKNWSSKPFQNGDNMLGIPFEFHKAGDLVDVDEKEKEEGLIGKNKLLAKALTKVRKQQWRFKSTIPEPGEVKTAEEILAVMQRENNRLMAMKDGEPDHMSDGAKEVWIKTLVDIKSLVASGADLSEYRKK